MRRRWRQRREGKEVNPVSLDNGQGHGHFGKERKVEKTKKKGQESVLSKKIGLEETKEGKELRQRNRGRWGVD